MDRTISSYFNVMARLNYTHFAARFGKHNIGAGEHRIIDYVCRHPGANQDEVAGFFSMNKGAASRMIQSLVKKNFITAETSPGDKRQKLLYPTEQGNDIFPFLDESRWEWERQFMEGVDMPREQLLSVLCQLENNMKRLVEKEKEALNAENGETLDP